MAALNLAIVWELFFETALGTSPLLPIAPFTPPLFFSNHLAISLKSVGAKPNWRLGCHAELTANVPGVGPATVGRRYVPLGTSLLVLDYDLTAFGLILEFPSWHHHVDLKIWQQAS